MMFIAAVAAVASIALAAGGVQVLRSGEDRLRGALMIVAALVLAGNVAIVVV